MAAGQTVSTASPRVTGLHGPWPDLLLGAGLGYVLTIPLLAWAASGGISSWSAGLTAVLALLVAGPHYGATLVRVYERRTDRQKYVVFAVYATLLIALAFALGLRSVLIGSLIVTLYVTWSPWHFAGQNYGIALMFLRRRGVAVEPAFKRWFYASFVLSFLLAILSIHRESSSLVYAQGASNYRLYEVLRLGIPREWVLWLAPILGALYAFSLAAAARGVLRAASPRALLEPGLLVLTQALWFALPAFGAMTGAYGLYGLAFAPIWISTAHAVQYLWVTSYYAKKSDPAVPVAPFLGKALLAGALVTILPGLVFAPHVLGGLTLNYADAAVLFFAAVNVHHFLLDGAVWKLRDGRVASVLLRTAPGRAAAEPGDAEPAGWLRPAAFALGAACVAAAVVVGFAHWQVSSPARPLAQMERAQRLLTWLGRGDLGACHRLAERHLQLGQPDHAIDEYRNCVTLARSQVRTPVSPDVTHRLAWLLLSAQGKNPASVAEAVKLADYTTRADPSNISAFELLADALAASGKLREAEATTRRAIEVARARGVEDRVPALEERLGRFGVLPPAADAPQRTSN